MLNDQMMKSLSGLPGSEHNLGTGVEGQRRVFAPRAGMGCDLGGGTAEAAASGSLSYPLGRELQALGPGLGGVGETRSLPRVCQPACVLSSSWRFLPGDKGMEA